MTRAAKEITEAVKEFRTVVERLAELQRPGGLPEEEAVRLAQEGVREVRAEIAREHKSSGGGSTAGKSAAGARATTGPVEDTEGDLR